MLTSNVNRPAVAGRPERAAVSMMSRDRARNCEGGVTFNVSARRGRRRPVTVVDGGPCCGLAGDAGEGWRGRSCLRGDRRSRILANALIQEVSLDYL